VDQTIEAAGMLRKPFTTAELLAEVGRVSALRESSSNT
jgi:hypothetical protein